MPSCVGTSQLARLPRSVCSSRASTAGCGGFTNALSGQQEQADGSDPEELHGVPDADQHDQVQPAGSSGLDELEAEAGCVEVGQGQQHRREPPFEAAAGTDGTEGDVGGHVAPHEVADVNAGAPDQADHGWAFPLLRTTS